MRHLSYLLLCFALVALPHHATAQDDDGGFLTRTIENALSGAGREVDLQGFAGALSSEASFERLTIADAEGIWLTLEDVQLVWTRSALLRGRLEVERLSAARLDLPRLPVAEESAIEVPQAEATPFSLPDLPVSINLEAFEVARISLGAPIIGTAAELSLRAAARLNDEGLEVDLTAERVDGTAGQFNIEAGFARDSEQITVNLALNEAAGGLVAQILNLPDQPSVDLTVAGTGPLDDFTADITLATDGAERVAGAVTLLAEPGADGDAPDRRISADISGDITALIATEYRDFFGPDVQLRVAATQKAAGGIDVSDFALVSRAATLTGAVRLNAEQWPEFIDLEGRIARADGQPVLLPGSGGSTRVQSVDLRVAYDAAAGEAFDGQFDIAGILRDDVRIARTALTLDGTLQGAAGSVGQFLGDLTFDASGLEMTDPEVARALGDQITGAANINYIEGQPIRISDLDVSGIDYGLAGDVVVRGLGDGFPTRLTLSVAAQDLSRFAGLAGQPIAGAADLTVAGTVTPLAGMFDLRVEGTTQDITAGIPQADALMAGRTTLALSARRDTTGTFVEDLALQNAALDITADADLQSGASTVTARGRLDNLGRVVPEHPGPVQFDVDAAQEAAGWRVTADLTAPYASSLSVEGLATGPDADIQIALSVPDVQPLVPQVSGPVALNGRVWQSPQGYRVDIDATGPEDTSLSVAGLATGPDADVDIDLKVPEVSPFAPQVDGPLAVRGRVFQTTQGYSVDVEADGPFASRVTVAGVVTGPEMAVNYSFAMPDIGVLVPEIRGALALAGDVAKEPGGWRVASTVDGPAGTQAQISGLVRDDMTLDLAIDGAAPLGLAGPFLAPRSIQGTAQFDLAVQGAPGLDAVSGTITARDARLTAPNLRLAIEGLDATVQLANARARINASGRATNGGAVEVSGAIDLAGALQSDLAIALRGLVLSDPRLYTTTVDGNLTIVGPVTSNARIAGQITVGETNVSVPSSGLTSIGDIPAIRHVGASSGARQTRGRAGLLDSEAPRPAQARDPSGGYRLGISVTAPGRIFVRGRGIDAELGGGLNISGTTNRIISAGEFSLVRGRIDILGRRFDLVEGSARFQGSLTPYLRFVTSSNTDAGTAQIIVDGPADAPEVSFSSSPEAPQDEVLAQLLFGRDIDEISAIQALQLANAVAVLAGRSGLGLVGSLRSGFGLDDLDITTTESGETAVRAGKYISENIYTDVIAAANGESEVAINLELTDSLKARGSVGEDGNTGIGFVFERDY